MLGGEYCFADGPDGAGIDAVDALQGEDAAEEGCAHDEDTAAEEEADDEFSVSLVLASASRKVMCIPAQFQSNFGEQGNRNRDEDGIRSALVSVSRLDFYMRLTRRWLQRG